MTTSLSLIAYASGIAANNPGCAEGPLQLQQHALRATIIRATFTQSLASYVSAA